MDYSADYSFLGLEGLKGGTQVKITNMAPFIVGVIGEDGNLTELQPYISPKKNDTRMVPFGMIYHLHLNPGGDKMLHEDIYIHDNNIRRVLNLPLIDPENAPETDYTMEDFKKIVLDDEEDKVIDALEFGPAYLGAWLKIMLVEITDLNIRNKYSAMLGIDPNSFKDNYEAMNGLGKYSGANSSTGESFSKKGFDGENVPEPRITRSRRERRTI